MAAKKRKKPIAQAPKKQLRSKRSKAAKKGWETRRKNAKKLKRAAYAGKLSKTSFRSWVSRLSLNDYIAYQDHRRKKRDLEKKRKGTPWNPKKIPRGITKRKKDAVLELREHRKNGGNYQAFLELKREVYDRYSIDSEEDIREWFHDALIDDGWDEHFAELFSKLS